MSSLRRVEELSCSWFQLLPPPPAARGWRQCSQPQSPATASGGGKHSYVISHFSLLVSFFLHSGSRELAEPLFFY